MSHAVDASRGARLVLGVLMAVVGTTLLPTLVTSEAALPAMAGVVLALVALLVVVRARSTSLAGGSARGATPLRGAEALVLPGRVTDPVHHPLRPRAPGHA